MYCLYCLCTVHSDSACVQFTLVGVLLVLSVYSTVHSGWRTACTVCVQFTLVGVLLVLSVYSLYSGWRTACTVCIQFTQVGVLLVLSVYSSQCSSGCKEGN